MYVCVCNAVTDRQIRDAATNGISSLSELRRTLAVPGPCGRCARCAHELLRATRLDAPDGAAASPCACE
ncbi:(2Fe-2S)-binding protein [Marichromatium gracile]|uniref:Bacterioferritin-associated ferredoxin n=1 Tax=Marichromatium gracile TaxID=1048 RepID=A0A4R4A9H7_MARGR|nr:(2Fe-2S)-binding protein [Marichromatium gracile]MBO8085004.1 (2Fe-2S)-binding protein [Marichromatium sp.]KXX63471.1 hypothetical protein AY586_05055 [Marichromatium gracile]MBK1708519.1 hypothetical protein [Marichromatium gracile]MCF1183089.1 (2Fe-2S)-binding protein [Marichromatium gracile]TCW35591.1 bacterioferritin-associated ferredoxin [Marichromatium gracile]